MSFHLGVLLLKRFVVVLCVVLCGVSCENETSSQVQRYLGVSYQEAFQVSAIKKLKKHYPITIVSWPVAWEASFPVKTVKTLLKEEMVPFIIWEAQFSPYSVEEIVDGVWDGYIASFAESIEEISYPVFLMLSTPSSEVKQHIQQLFEEKEIVNVIWATELIDSEGKWTVVSVDALDEYKVQSFNPSTEAIQKLR